MCVCVTGDCILIFVSLKKFAFAIIAIIAIIAIKTSPTVSHYSATVEPLDSGLHGDEIKCPS